MGPLAVHLSDGVLTPAWWLGGWVLAAIFVFLGAWRLRDEDIPRVALLAAAFFVVTLIHVPVPGGPRAHLLLVGLLGVVLGRHAALAIPLGLVLQTLLFSHGGLTMIGVNSVVMTLPALVCWGLFAALRTVLEQPAPYLRSLLIFSSVVLFLLSTVFAVGLLLSNPWTETDSLDTATALNRMLSPGVLVGTVALSLFLVWLERRHSAGPEFAVGLLLGELGVLLAVALNGLVLLLGGERDWHAVVFLTVLIHLPLAVIEGVILGFTMRFLARVQPDLLIRPTSTQAVPTLALLAALVLPGTASAHGFEAEARIDVTTKTVRVECWYETGDAPRKATLQVLRPEGSILTTVELQQGKGTFQYDRIEELTLLIDAGAGHKVKLVLPESKLLPEAEPTGPGESTRAGATPLRDILSGLAFVLALAAFVLSWRNSQRLQRLETR